MSSETVAALEPRVLWTRFAELTRIPRPSKQEERVVAWVRELAAGHGWDVRADDVGNLVVAVPASAGREHAPTVVLQAHLDMVCEKNEDVAHDFERDPLELRVDDDWVSAVGTTLGADNGIGVAAALAAALDPDVVHGPLELLFTIDEETGLTGAQQLDGTIVKGRTLLNLDSEEDGVLFVGCAGGADATIRLPLERLNDVSGEAVRLSVRGLRGGHSGMEIHENRGNALTLLARVLDAAREESIELGLVSIEGGSKHNAIPREASAGLLLPDGAREALGALVDRIRPLFAAELAGVDDGLRLELVDADAAPGAALRAADRDRLVGLLRALPHGVLGMSRAIPGLVETSCNLASVRVDGAEARVLLSARSSVDSLRDATLRAIAATARLAGGEVEIDPGYPGWRPDLDSAALEVLREVYAEIWGERPEVTAVHAGLECGLLAEKVPGLDMVSFGPTIEGAHSPTERVSIASVARFWDALSRALERLSS